MLRYILLNSWVLLFLVGCDTKQNVIYTGVSNPYFDGTIMDYLRSNKGNWELTVEMIERAGLVDLFEGNDESVPEMTFWAPPSYSRCIEFLTMNRMVEWSLWLWMGIGFGHAAKNRIGQVFRMWGRWHCNCGRSRGTRL